MKTVKIIGLTVGFVFLSSIAWANGKKEAPVEGPPYTVRTVMRILSSNQLYQEGYLQREMDKNGDGINDETGKRIYAGNLRQFRDGNGDGLDDATGGELPLGLHNRLIDRNGDGVVDGTTEDVGQYINRIRIEAQLRYEQGEGDGEGDQLQIQTRTREENQSSTQTQSHAATGTQARNGVATD